MAMRTSLEERMKRIRLIIMDVDGVLTDGGIYMGSEGEAMKRFDIKDGLGITDDHLPVNEVAHIPCIDIIPYYPDCEQSSFGPTWHTVSDDMQHLDRNTLRAVGQTLVQLIFTE